MKLYHRVTVDEPNTVTQLAILTIWDSPHYHGFILTLPFPVYKEFWDEKAVQYLNPYNWNARVIAGWWLYQIVRVTESYSSGEVQERAGFQHISKGYWFPWKTRTYGRRRLWKKVS